MNDIFYLGEEGLGERGLLRFVQEGLNDPKSVPIHTSTLQNKFPNPPSTFLGPRLLLVKIYDLLSMV